MNTFKSLPTAAQVALLVMTVVVLLVIVAAIIGWLIKVLIIAAILTGIGILIYPLARAVGLT